MEKKSIILPYSYSHIKHLDFFRLIFSFAWISMLLIYINNFLFCFSHNISSLILFYVVI